MDYLLDTCVIIDFVRGSDNIIQKMKSLSPHQVAVSSITEFELRYGMEISSNLKSKSRTIVEAILSEIHILKFRSEEAIQAARVRNQLKIQGMPIGAYDVLIVATAFTHDLTLVTSNEKEFLRVHDLKVENWR